MTCQWRTGERGRRSKLIASAFTFSVKFLVVSFLFCFFMLLCTVNKSFPSIHLCRVGAEQECTLNITELCYCKDQ